MRAAKTLFALGLILCAIAPTFAADNLPTGRVDLWANGAISMYDSEDAVMVDPTDRGPTRDPGADEIVYDRWNDQFQQYYFYVAQNYWSRVSFTAAEDFELQGIRLMLFNQFNRQTADCNISIYLEDANHNLTNQLWTGRIDNILDRQWSAFDLDEEDYETIDRGNHFSVVYGKAPGGAYQQGSGWWHAMDNAQQQAPHSFFSPDNNFPTQHGSWTGGTGFATAYNLICRANGEFQGEVIDIAADAFTSVDMDDVTRWTALVGQQRNLNVEVANRGDAVDGVIATWTLRDVNEQIVWEDEVLVEEQLGGNESITMSPNEPWAPEAAGHFICAVTVTPFGDDFDMDNNTKTIELIVVDPENEPDFWLSYVEDDGAFENNYYNTDSTAFATYFWHPGGEESYTISNFRACLRVPETTDQETIPFAVMSLDLERGWSVTYSASVDVSETGDAVWYEVEIPEESRVSFDVTKAMIVCWFFREIGADQNNWIMMKHDATPPVSGANGDMPTTNRWSADIWADGFNNAWGTGEWAIEAQFLGADPGGPLLAIEPEVLEFGYGLERAQDHVISAMFIAYGDSAVSITNMQASPAIADFVSFERTNFTVEPGDTEFVNITFNCDTLADFNSRVQVVNNSRNVANRYFWELHAGTVTSVIKADLDQVDFGSIDQGNQVTRSIVLSNPGIQAVDVSDIAIPAEFVEFLSVSESAFSIEPDGEKTIEINFHPNAPINIRADIVVMNNSQNDPELEIEIVASTTSVENDGSIQPDEFALLQNHPNPFNPTTSISFNMPVAGVADLSVFTLDGRQVGNLVSGHVTAGVHTVQMDAAGLPAGVYVYKLSAADFVGIRKMVLLK